MGLLKHRAKVDAVDKNSRSPLMLACLNAHEQVALWLMWKEHADKHLADVFGNTPEQVGRNSKMPIFKKALKRQENAANAKVAKESLEACCHRILELVDIHLAKVEESSNTAEVGKIEVQVLDVVRWLKQNESASKDIFDEKR